MQMKPPVLITVAANEMLDLWKTKKLNVFKELNSLIRRRGIRLDPIMKTLIFTNFTLCRASSIGRAVDS